jgi:hypothetical protein
VRAHASRQRAIYRDQVRCDHQLRTLISPTVRLLKDLVRDIPSTQLSGEWHLRPLRNQQLSLHNPS